MKAKLIIVVFFTLCGVGATQIAEANYAAAQQFFARRDYVRSASAYFQSYSYPRSKQEKINAEWGLAESLKKMQLLYSASKYYSVIVRRGMKRSNPYFQKALSELGRINSTVSLGQSHIVQLFKSKVSASYIPGNARGFYFYYLGIEAFSRRQFEKAGRSFQKVPSGTPYSLGSQFYLGVISNLSGRHSRAISYFERVVSGARSSRHKEMRESALLNIARVHYETRRYRQAIRFYGQISRDSENWLEALWEASWALFIMQNHNAALGTIHTIHSPFFVNRFYPESYILQAITFLRLCRYRQVEESLKRFRGRYKGTFRDISSVLNRFDGNSKGFFRMIYDYRVGNSNRYKGIWPILDKLSRTDSYKEAGDTIRFSDRERSRLGRFSQYWKSSGLQDELESFLSQKKSLAQSDAGRRLYNKATGFYKYLKELSDQTGLIQAEMLEGKLDVLRKKIKVNNPSSKRVQFGGGLQELKVAQRYEYWPFEQEYWEDELGYYLYNLESRCGSKSRGKR